MSTRRQASTTSLSRYARAHSPEFADRSLDFCNTFWGTGDAGVDVLFARMRGALRTMEELRNFWKERAMIEEQYAKRLTALAKSALGKDEIGELRNSLETLRQETEKQAGFHMNVAQQVKNDLEGPANALLNRQLHHKKNYQTAIEREFKMKQQQESHVAKAREKYEQDCLRINSFTAQATITQGKELEKIHSKLERAQQTVSANEQDFQKFVRVLQDTTVKWEQDWKDFCDRCQDLEEERMEFMKDNMWAYANMVSIVCVSDDESCERVRLALEQFEPEKDMEGFVYNYGTGNAIPHPAVFINYANPDSSTAAAQRAISRPANFQRVTDRPREFFPPSQPSADDDVDPQDNTAGVGARGGRPEPPAPTPSRPSSRQSTRNPLPNQGPSTTSVVPNGRGGINASQAATAQGQPVLNEPMMLKVGDRAYPVDPTNNPQEIRAPSALSGAPSAVGHDNDPLAITMRELQGSARRPQQAVQPEPQQAPVRPAHQHKDSTSSQLSPPPGGRGGGPPNKLDYRRSAEFVVGGPPPTNGSSRPASPNPPTAILAMPPAQPQDDTVRNVLADYQQSFPGERKSISRPGSRAGSISGPNSMQQQSQQPAQRPISSNSMAGVGAQGRSPSPQPFRPPSRAASPMQQPIQLPMQPPMQLPMQPFMQRGVTPAANRNVSPAAPPNQLPPQNMSQPINGRRTSMRSTTGSYGGGTATPFTQANGVGPGHQSRQNSITQPMQRPVSPNPVGIALDRDGRVVDDELANQYPARGYQASLAPQQSGYGAMQQPQVPGYTQPMQAQPQRGYGAPPQPPAAGYGPNQGQYVQHAPPPQPVAPPPPQQPPYGQQQYGQYSQPDYSRPNGAPALGGHPQPGYYANPAGQQYPPQSYGAQRAPSPRAPSPQPMQQVVSPTGAYTDDGRPILFYVTALYDYQATIDEEFDFQTNDVIAVTATPEDGWWSGELLDEARKQPGRHVFPSNFVRLL